MMLEILGQPFNLNLTLCAGQTFRWRKESDGGDVWWNGVVRGQLIRIRQENGGDLEFECAPGPDSVVREMLHNYFRLDDNYEEICRSISRDSQMAGLVQEYRGLRLMRQEPWECLISYLCSANNNVPQISILVERICEKYGGPIDGQERRAFPTSQRIFQTGLDEIESLRLRLNRGRYIYEAASAAQSGRLDLDALRENPSCYAVVRKLESLNGVAEKIADCVALFSLDMLEAFPVDRHIRKGMREMYFPGNLTVDDGEILLMAHRLFGLYAGYAGQFIFRHYRPQTKGSGYSGRRRRDRKFQGGGR